MFASINKFRSVATVLILAVIAVLVINLTAVNRATASGDTSVIVELKDDPGAVYEAKARKSGTPVSAEALQAYRAGLSAKQDEFLAALASNGVAATVMSRDIKNFDGSLAATIPLR